MSHPPYGSVGAGGSMVVPRTKRTFLDIPHEIIHGPVTDILGKPRRELEDMRPENRPMFPLGVIKALDPTSRAQLRTLTITSQGITHKGIGGLVSIISKPLEYPNLSKLIFFLMGSPTGPRMERTMAEGHQIAAALRQQNRVRELDLSDLYLPEYQYFIYPIVEAVVGPATDVAAGAATSETASGAIERIDFGFDVSNAIFSLLKRARHLHTLSFRMPTENTGGGHSSHPDFYRNLTELVSLGRLRTLRLQTFRIEDAPVECIEMFESFHNAPNLDTFDMEGRWSFLETIRILSNKNMQNLRIVDRLTAQLDDVIAVDVRTFIERLKTNSTLRSIDVQNTCIFGELADNYQGTHERRLELLNELQTLFMDAVSMSPTLLNVKMGFISNIHTLLGFVQKKHLDTLHVLLWSSDDYAIFRDLVVPAWGNRRGLWVRVGDDPRVELVEVF